MPHELLHELLQRGAHGPGDAVAGIGLGAGQASIRRQVRTFGFRTRTADALIAQSCIDHDVALATCDGDIRHFAEHCGLRLA